jgi:hypothetical protein
MIAKKTLPYSWKKLIPTAMLALTPAAFMSCDKDDEPEVPLHDTEYTFNIDTNEWPTFEQIKASADSSSVRTIYLRPLGNFTGFAQENITGMRNKYFQPTVEISPKVRGIGNFEFVPGRVLPTDSLWYLANGWTINQHQK